MGKIILSDEPILIYYNWGQWEGEETFEELPNVQAAVNLCNLHKDNEHFEIKICCLKSDQIKFRPKKVLVDWVLDV